MKLPLLPSALSPEALAAAAELLGLRLPATARGVFIPSADQKGVLLERDGVCHRTGQLCRSERRSTRRGLNV